MNRRIVKSFIMKASAISLVSLFSLAIHAADGVSSASWSSPVSTFSNATLSSGSEGIGISASLGGYLTGVYENRLQVATKEDLEYTEVNYLLLNNASNSGLTIESSWSEDVEFYRSGSEHNAHYDDVNSVDVGLFSTLFFADPRVTAYPKMQVGYMWGDSIVDTTYVKFEVAVRFDFDDKMWVGATPLYSHGMDGVEIDELGGSIEAGMKLSETFGISASVDSNEEFLGNVIFAF